MPSRKFIEKYKNRSNVDYSVDQVSARIDKVMRGKRDGFFIECGAIDGTYQSTSVFFEVTRNWTGLLIGGNIHFRSKLLSAGRNAYILNSCLSIKSTPMWTEFVNADGYGGLQSSVGKVKISIQSSVTPVTCYPFNAIMEAIGRTHIDLFILDVQGVEMNILKTIDFHKYRIDVIVAEHAPFPGNKTLNMTRINDYRQFFKSTGLYTEVYSNGPWQTFNDLDILVHRKDFQVGNL